MFCKAIYNLKKAILENMEVYEEYIENDRTLRVKRSIIGCILAIILVPTGSIVDLVLYPNFFIHFIKIRLFCSLALILLLAFHYTKLGRHYIKFLNFIWITLLQVLMCWIIFVTDKHLSVYYSSLNIVILATSVLLAFRALEMAMFCVITLSLYLFVTFDANLTKPEILFNNIYFIVLSSIISITATYFNSKYRFREFCLNHELEIKNKELEKLDKIKSQFFSNISHEFRTPLTLIFSPVQDILEENSHLSEKVTSHLKIVQNNAFRLLKLINSLLDITRLEENKYELTLTKLEITNLTKYLVDSLSHLAKSKNIELVKNIYEQELYIFADVDAVEKIILNLLTNAIKFTNDGGKITITVSKNNQSVVISIKDNGIGINEENINYIFDRFKQVDGSNTRKHQGSGLGLALAKELAALQNGHIKVESKLNQGTKFDLIFSEFTQEKNVENKISEKKLNLLNQNNHNSYLYTVSKTAECTISEIGTKKCDNEPLNKNLKTILIVEDEPDMLNYIASLFENENYNILQAKDGESALEMTDKHNPDLVILDLMLPEIDGLSICKKLKLDEKTRLIKIVMLTAKSDEKSKLTALRYGVDDFLNKPFSSKEIKSRINNMLQSGRTQKELNLELKELLNKLNISQNRLIQSEKLNTIGSLSTGILHEVKNPLNYMVTALYSLKLDPTIINDPDLMDTVKDIEEGMERIKNIVSDIRSFAHPKEIDKAKFLLKEVIESALKFTKQELRDVKINVEINSELQVIASRNHILQVLINLISNAIKAIKESKNKDVGEITICCKQDGNKALLMVTDNGTGISEENLKVIFNPFFTTKDIGSGMGLGLNISYTIVESHDSKLEVTSEIGKGTSFYFALPVI